MKLSKRILLTPVALFLALCSILAGPTEARAASVPKFPTCVRTHVDHDTMRVWLWPGNLHKVRSVQAGDVSLRRRDDGIYYGDISKPDPRAKNVVYFSYNRSKAGAWVKCEKVLRHPSR